MEAINWDLIDKYFKNNPYNLVAHHLDSFNKFFSSDIFHIFRENNPFKFVAKTVHADQTQDKILIYMGGKNADKIYFGKPVIYDLDNVHYMYPNEARLRNMTYGVAIHYDVDVDVFTYDTGNEIVKTVELKQIYLGSFPIMLHSNLCILNGLSPEVRFNMGECRNDLGGYFIINGKEKSIISQESRADNMIYVLSAKPGDDTEVYSHTAQVKSVSEDASKPIRTVMVKIVAPSTTLSNNQIVVEVPNVRKPVPLFILMRALGVLSDKNIIKYCLLDLEANEQFIDLFIPSIHDAFMIFNQVNALKYIATFTKRQTISNTMEILMNSFLPHIGELNLLDKAYYVGYMVYKMLKVYMKQEQPTNRDSFKYKRVELSGALIYDLFREYYLIQKKHILLKIEKVDYYGNIGDLAEYVEQNQNIIFKNRLVESGVRKAFKGNWGSQANTKRIGVVQDLNRLSWNTFMCQLRRITLPLSSSAKVVGPHLLHNSQWGFIDPIDTPDGGNIGLHKHLAISCLVTSGYSSFPIIELLRKNKLHPLKILQECSPEYIASSTKVFVNGNWIGVVETPIELTHHLKLLRRNAIIPIYTSISFEYEKNEIQIYTDSGRLTRPIYYIDQNGISASRLLDKGSPEVMQSGDFKWIEVASGFYKKKDDSYNVRKNKVYNISELYELPDSPNAFEILAKHAALVDYIDSSEEENSYIANTIDVAKSNKHYTHVEIDPSFMFGIMGNSVIFPEHNPLPRNSFSCGQSKQAVSLYHSNAAVRFDKSAVVLNYGQIPLVKSRYLEYINKEEHPYGVNAMVAIMSHTGYNVEDATLINEGSLKRGLFNTTYFSTYESSEDNSTSSTSTFANVSKDPTVVGLDEKHDYNYLDEHGLIKENTEVHDKMVIIGKKINGENKNEMAQDDSTLPKKGQLGIVDKVFVTDTAAGTRIAKVRIREVRIPAIGDKMASRAGQKGTIGLVIPEEDMPFTADGLRPDIIINPHAIPSRMTIGQLVECLLGNVCSLYGGFGDCTAFATKGSNYDVYGPMLTKLGYHNSGNRVFYSGVSGKQLEADVFFGPTYYMRLKHMVKDKINFRAKGPRTMLTRQTVQGRANDGGLRIGEMERDGVLAHGASAFLNESYMIRGDEYYVAICNKTGALAIYNESLNLFLSPLADGPIRFDDTLKGGKNINNISRFGRSFSIIRVPYTFKLLIQELQVMNVQMRIITDKNVDQLMNMGYESKNIQKLLNIEDYLTTYAVMDHVKRVDKLKKMTSPSDGTEVSIITPEEIEYQDFSDVNVETQEQEQPGLQEQQLQGLGQQGLGQQGLGQQGQENQALGHQGLGHQGLGQPGLGQQGLEQMQMPSQGQEVVSQTNLLQQQGELLKQHGELIQQNQNQGQGQGQFGGAVKTGNDTWVEQFSVEKGLPYWYNSVSGESVWKLPVASPKSLFMDKRLQDLYNSLDADTQSKIDSLPSQGQKDMLLKKIDEEIIKKKMAEQFKPIESPIDILSVDKDKDNNKNKEENNNRTKEETDKTDNSIETSSSSSSSGEKKVINLS